MSGLSGLIGGLGSLVNSFTTGGAGVVNNVGGGGGLSGMDLSMIQQALGMGSDMIHNRYEQLGLGVPDPGTFGGDPATAAAAGGSLSYGGPSTMETADIHGLGNIVQAALGQLQQGNINNPAIPGSAANIGQNIQQSNSNLGQIATNAGFSENLNSNINQTPSTSSG